MKTLVSRTLAIAALLAFAGGIAAPAFADTSSPTGALGAQRTFTIKDDSAADADIAVYVLDATGHRVRIHSVRIRKGATVAFLANEGQKYVLTADVIRVSPTHKVVQPGDHVVDPSKTTEAFLRNADAKYYWM